MPPYYILVSHYVLRIISTYAYPLAHPSTWKELPWIGLFESQDLQTIADCHSLRVYDSKSQPVAKTETGYPWSLLGTMWPFYLVEEWDAYRPWILAPFHALPNQGPFHWACSQWRSICFQQTSWISKSRATLGRSKVHLQLPLEMNSWQHTRSISSVMARE